MGVDRAVYGCAHVHAPVRIRREVLDCIREDLVVRHDRQHVVARTERRAEKADGVHSPRATKTKAPAMRPISVESVIAILLESQAVHFARWATEQ